MAQDLIVSPSVSSVSSVHSVSELLLEDTEDKEVTEY